jgi:hypothetical protein
MMCMCVQVLKLTENNVSKRDSQSYINYAVREVIIIDDASSPADRLKMMIATENCTACTIVLKGTCACTSFYVPLDEKPTSVLIKHYYCF